MRVTLKRASAFGPVMDKNTVLDGQRVARVLSEDDDVRSNRSNS